MTTSLHWTLLFAGLLALLQFVLTLAVVARRATTDIDLGDGGDTTLLRRIRAHGNFAEVVPMALLLLAFLELGGLASKFIVALGSALLLGRVLHAGSMLTNNAKWSRRGGTAICLFVVSVQAVLCLWQFFTT
jgi:uncharacterized protein